MSLSGSEGATLERADSQPLLLLLDLFLADCLDLCPRTALAFEGWLETTITADMVGPKFCDRGRG
jgi:hypothetical protein